MKSKIKPFQYSFTRAEVNLIAQSLKQILIKKNYLTMGNYGEKFEKDFSRYCQLPYAVACSSGTSALEIVLKFLNIKGREVIIPSNTFFATASAVLGAGGTPIFAECEDDMCLSPNDVEKKINKRTAAVITVHIGGHISTNIMKLQKICKKNSIHLVEDAAHAHGSTYKSKHAGSFGIAATYSFYPTKVMTTFEGGMIVTKNKNLFNYAKLIRNHGQLKDNLITELGNNWRLNEFSALVGIVQLKKLSNFIRFRKKIANYYDKNLKSKNFIKLQTSKDCSNNYYKYIILVKNCNTDKLIETIKLKYEISFPGRVYPIPCHLQPVWSKISKRKYHLKNTEHLCKQHLCLPIYPEMTISQAKKITEILNSLLN